MSTQAVEEHIGTVTGKGTVVIAVAVHHGDRLLLVILSSHGRYLTHGECTIRMLDDLVADQCASPCGLTISTHVDVLLEDSGTDTVGAPSPDVAVGTVGGSLSGIEGTAVEHTLLAVLRPVGTRVVEACLQVVVTPCHHILHLTAPRGTVCLAVDQIPVVTHLEDVRTLTHTVPDHGELSYVLPVLEVGGLELGKLQVAGDDHAPCAVVDLEHLWVTEVLGRETIVAALQLPLLILRPCLEVRRGGAHHYLTVGQQHVIARIIDVIELVGLVIDSASRTEGSVLQCRGSPYRQYLTDHVVVGTVLGADTPEGMVAGTVIVVLLQIEHLELARLLVVERHGVATASESGRVVGEETLLVSRVEEGGRSCPVLFRIWSEAVLAACRQHDG